MHWVMRFIEGCWIIFLIYWIVAALSAKRSVRKAPLRDWLPLGAAVVCGVALIDWALAVHRMGKVRMIMLSPLLAVVCVALAGGGLALAIYARRHLGANWSARVSVQQDHELIRSGPYRWMRHPIYSGMLLMLLGTVLAQGTPHAFLLFVVLSIGFWWKLRLEERLMRQTFGQDYIDYQSKVKALIPGVL